MTQAEWYKEAAKFLKIELTKAEVTYQGLADRLTAMGVEETFQSVAAKINRGSFSFAFFMQCMEALGTEQVRF